MVSEKEIASRKDTAVRAALEAGMDRQKVFSFDDPRSTGKFLQSRLESGDLALIKGSQGARMEKVVREIMAHPEKAAKLLVRQTKDWQ